MRIHWQYAPNMTCSQRANTFRREAPKKLTLDPTKVTCGRCKKLFAGNMAAALAIDTREATRATAGC